MGPDGRSGPNGFPRYRPPAVDDIVTIPARYNGPPHSGNGGYAAGLTAAALDAPGVRVRLRRPPPLDTELRRRAHDDGTATLERGDELIATAQPAPAMDQPAPAAPTLDQATDAAARFPGFAHHGFPTCFVCGTERPDGLHVHPGPVDGRPDLIACPYTPPNDDPLLTWAALDCPGAFVSDAFLDPDRLAVLATFTVRADRAPTPRAPHVVAAWRIDPAAVGRKQRTASALFDAEGELLAIAEALWIEVRDRSAFA